jgi:hypothetical protein
MGSIDSPVTAISRVRFNPMKSSDGVADVARITKSGNWCIYVLTKRGAVYTNGSMGRSISLTGSTGEEATALHGLGLITKTELRVHKQYIAALKAWRDIRHRIDRFEKEAEQFGIPLMEAHKDKFARLMQEAEAALKATRIEAQRLNAERQAREAQK